MGATKSGPQVGDLVQFRDKQQVVTDIRAGTFILRPVRGAYSETPVEDPDTLRLIARGGEWRP